MIRIRIQYDKYNRTFKLLDKEFGSLLDDGDVYELPVSLCEFCPAPVDVEDDHRKPAIGASISY